MDIILLQDVENLGTANDLVSVKGGYARNFLIPKRLAVVASKSNRKVREERLRQDERRQEKLLSQLQDVVDKLKSSVITIGTKVGTTGKIFGSVTTHHLAEAIKRETGANIDRRKITILEEPKALGTYAAEVDLHEDVKVQFNFEVVAE